MKKFLGLFFLLLIIIYILWWFFCRKTVEDRPPVLLTNEAGVETTEFQMYESVLFDAVDLSPRTGYEIQVVREDGEIVTELALSTNALGMITRTVLWYDIGIGPCPGEITTLPENSSATAYDIGDYEYSGMSYSVKILQSEKLVREVNFRVSEAFLKPVLYAANARSCPESGFLIGEEDVWVVGRNFPKGSIVRLWAVPASADWKEGDPLVDKTTQYDDMPPPVFELRADETGFIKKLWPKELTSLGSYDIVADVITYKPGNYHQTATAPVQNLVSYQTYSGFVIQRRPGVAEPLEVNIAGCFQSPFTFKNTFLTTEDVYVGVDPCMQPTYIGQTAKVFIVPNQNDAWWTVNTAIDLNTLDVTGYIETIAVGSGCGNCYGTLAWSAPLVIGEYDVVLDFNKDNLYTPGVDLIDALNPVGFVVSEIRVNTVSFNYSGSGAVTIRDNINKVNISAPEYYAANHIVRAAAWIAGGSHSVMAEFVAVPSVSSAQIWAENGLGGLNSSGSPVTVTFSGGTGQGVFSVNTVPSSISKNLFFWDWNYKNVNGSPTSDVYMGETGEHLLYCVNSTPQPPMATPWLDVLEYGTNWAAGMNSESDVVNGVIDGLYNSGMVYNGSMHHTPDYGTFYLNNVFAELRTGGLTVYMDCRDCANFFHVLTNALGFSHQYLRIPGFFTFEPLDPMGPAPCAGGGWNYHQVGWCGSHVADGSARVACTVLSVCDYSAVDYINLLTNTPGITAGSTNICSPQE